VSAAEKQTGGAARNLALERRLLDSLVQRARAHFGVECGPFPQAVLRRWKLGARRYGEGSFLAPERDNLREVQDECRDLAGYSILELERLAREPGGVPEQVRDDLLRIALLGAVADAYAGRAGRRLREGRP
jgi:hypothetical protein